MNRQKINACHGVGSLLRFHTEDELAEQLLRRECHQKFMEERKNMRPIVPNTITSEVGVLLSPELEKTRFVQFREKFYENMYFSKPKLGKSKPAFTKPLEVTNSSRTFGKSTKKHPSLYELILPKRKISEVNQEFLSFHDKKLISHHHYLPAERINRHYTSPPYNSDATFGKLDETNKSGIQVKKCLKEKETTTVISAVQNKFLERTQSTLGKKLKSLSSIELPEDMIMGSPPPKNVCNAKAVIENTYPCEENKELANAVVHLNKVRRRLFTRPDLHINDLRLELQHRDERHMGYLPLAAIVEVAYNFHLLIDANKIHPLLKHFQLLHNEGQPSECVDYEAFCRLLQVQYPLPAIPKPVALENMHNKQTTYRDMCRDLTALKTQKISEEEDAALLRYKNLKEKIILAKHTTAKNLVSPDIPTRLGLSPVDFEFPRSKDDLRRIFKRVLLDNDFDEIWTKLHEKIQDVHELYTVNELRSQLKSDNPEKLNNPVTPLGNLKNVAEREIKVVEEKSLPAVTKIKNETEVEKNQENVEIDNKAGGDVISSKEKKIHFSNIYKN